MEYTLEKLRYTKVRGFAFDETTRKVFDNTAEERNARLEEFYQGGGYRVFFSGYSHIMLDQAANDEIYYFWRRKTHERMTDPTKAEILAPTKPPHPFAGKRPSLEQDYYEMMDKPNVTLVDVKSNRVTYFVSNGIVVADGTVHEAEVIALVTGLDAVTGGFKDIDITELGGLTLQERWNDGTHVYLGMAVSGFQIFLYLRAVFAFGV